MGHGAFGSTLDAKARRNPDLEVQEGVGKDAGAVHLTNTGWRLTGYKPCDLAILSLLRLAFDDLQLCTESRLHHKQACTRNMPLPWLAIGLHNKLQRQYA